MARFVGTLLLLVVSQIASASTSSGIILSHPLSQQFPPVARVKQAFSWTFSDSTFSITSNNTTLLYTALNLPPWLGFTASNRSLSGCPTANDIGAYDVQITATTPDGQSSLMDQVRLEVSERSGGINVTYPIALQLVANDSAITSAFPYSQASPLFPGVRVPPNWSFSLGFQPSTLTAVSKIFYSASMVDGTPLPPWLEFNANSVTFDGVTPNLATGISTLYQIALSGSDINGYSDIKQTFNISIAAHELALVQPTAALNLTSGYPLNTTLDILSSFTLDDKALHVDQVAQVTLETSTLGWLSYNPQNMSLFGTPPSGQDTTALPLTITDKYGDTLNTTVSLAFFPSHFTSDQLRPALATPGQAFNVSLPKYFTNGSSVGLNISAVLNPQKAGAWLSLYASNYTLQGIVPSDVEYDTISVLLRAQDLVTHAWSHAEMIIPLAANGTTNADHAHRHGLSTGTAIGMATVGSIVGALFLLILILTACRRYQSNRMRKETEDADRDLDVEKWATETPAMEYAEKMGEPASIQMLVGRIEPDVLHSLPRLSSGISSSKRVFLKSPFAKRKVPPKISNPIITPSFSNAAFQAQLAAAVESSGIVKRGSLIYTTTDTTSDFTECAQEGARSGTSGRSVTDDSQFLGHSSRASWESEAPFAWTGADISKHQSQDIDSLAVTSEDTHEASIVSVVPVDEDEPVQRSEFRPTLIPALDESIVVSGNTTDEGISIDNIHFPTDSDIAHTEASSDNDAVITTVTRIDARHTLDSPVSAASPASNHTEKVSPVMTTHSRLVSFGNQRTVTVNAGARSASQTAVVSSTSTQNPTSPSQGSSAMPPSKPSVASTSPMTADQSRSPTPPGSLPSLPALPTLPSATSSRIARDPVAAQRILLGVAEPFHFYPPLSISPSLSGSRSTSSASTAPSSSVAGAEYIAFIERDGEALQALPDWLHFEEMELWGVPEVEDRGVWDVRVVERVRGMGGLVERVVGRFALEVVGRP